MFNVASHHLQHSHVACDWCLCLHELKCDPTFTVIIVDMSRLHFRAETEFCTQSPILKNTLSYIFQINIGPFFFLLVCRVHLPETLSEPQPYLYTIDLLFLSTRILSILGPRLSRSLFLSPSLEDKKQLFHATLASTIHLRDHPLSYDVLSHPCQDIHSKQISLAAPVQHNPAT